MMDADTASERFYNWQRRKKSEGTASRYRNCLRKWRDWLHERDKSLFDATQADFRDYIHGLIDDEYAPDTIKVRKVAVSQFYTVMETSREEGSVFPDSILNGDGEVTNLAGNLKLNGNYMKQGTMKSQNSREDIFYLEPEEIERLKENVNPPEVRNELIVMLLYQLGLRRSELARLRVTDIVDTGEPRKVNIRNKKGGNNRVNWYKPSLDTNLNIWLNSERDAILHAAESIYLFPTKESEHISDCQVSCIVSDAAKNANLQEVIYTDKKGHKRNKVTAHSLRHSYANRMITGENSIDIARLQDLMGHKDIEQTRRYLQFKDSQKRDAAINCW